MNTRQAGGLAGVGSILRAMSELANPPLYKAAERQASEAKEPAWADALPWADCPLPGRCPVEGLLSQQELNLAY